MTVAYVWWLLDGTEDENDEALHDELAMERGDAEVVMRPFAKRLARSMFNRKWGRSILEGDDFFESFITMGAYILSMRKHLRRRIRYGNIIPGPWNRDPAPNMEVNTRHEQPDGSRSPSSNGHGPVVGPWGSGRIPTLSTDPN